MIQSAKIKNAGIEYLQADVFDLPFESKSFDVVIATSLINIVSDKSKAINELLRVCKIGGRVSILVPSADFNDKDLCQLHQLLHTSGFSYAALSAWHENPPKMETDDIISLFNKSGLIDITTKKYLRGLVVSASAIKLT